MPPGCENEPVLSETIPVILRQQLKTLLYRRGWRSPLVTPHYKPDRVPDVRLRLGLCEHLFVQLPSKHSDNRHPDGGEASFFRFEQVGGSVGDEWCRCAIDQGLLSVCVCGTAVSGGPTFEHVARRGRRSRRPGDALFHHFIVLTPVFLMDVCFHPFYTCNVQLLFIINRSPLIRPTPLRSLFFLWCSRTIIGLNDGFSSIRI